MIAKSFALTGLVIMFGLSGPVAGSSAARAQAPGTVQTPSTPQTPATPETPAVPQTPGTPQAPGTTPPPPASAQAPGPTAQTTPPCAPQLGEALALLGRMQQLLDRREEENGKSLKGAGKVTYNRSDVDEVAAEIQMLKVMLQR